MIFKIFNCRVKKMIQDYWKEKLNYLQHKNMSKKDGEYLTKEMALSEIKKFSRKYPAIKTDLVDNSSYITWEAFVSKNIKLRFYLQSQIKISFMEIIDGVFTKVADAKFPYNPFPEINEFFDKADVYLSEYSTEKNKSKQLKMKQKITYEFIKALLMKKIDGKKNYTIDINDEDFTLLLKNSNGSENSYLLNEKNFRQIINNL